MDDPVFVCGSGMYRKNPNHTYGRNRNNSAIPWAIVVYCSWIQTSHPSFTYIFSTSLMAVLRHWQGPFFRIRLANGVHFTNCWFCSNDQMGTSFSFIPKLLNKNSRKLVTHWLLQLKSLKLTSKIEGYCQYWKLFSHFVRKFSLFVFRVS